MAAAPTPVLRALRVAQIADSGQTYGGHAYHDCLDTAATRYVPILQPRAGAIWRTNDGVILSFIGPSLPFIGGSNAINDNSVAFILQYRQFRMLFTGDAGVAAERRFLDSDLDLHADVLKSATTGQLTVRPHNLLREYVLATLSSALDAITYLAIPHRLRSQRCSTLVLELIARTRMAAFLFYRTAYRQL